MAKAKNIFEDFLKTSKIKDLESASILEQSKMSNIGDWISTGSYALNKVISGSYKKGIPQGRMIGFVGLSGTGKSYISVNCAREAQRKGYHVVIFDSENAIDADFMGRLGVDVANVLHIPVQTVNELKNKGIQVIRRFHEQYGTDEKLFIVVDSIGGLMTDNELYDNIEDNKTTADMGLRAKQLRVASKAFTHEIAKWGDSMIFTNHTYEKPSPNPKVAPVEVMQGGEGFTYQASALVFLKRSVEKEDKKNRESNRNEKIISGVVLRARTEKNRFVPMGARADIYLSYEKGMNKFYGLLEDALEFEFITNEKVGWFEVPKLGKKLRKAELYKREIWDEILEELNEKVEEKYKFSTFMDTDEVEVEIEAIDEE